MYETRKIVFHHISNTEKSVFDEIRGVRMKHCIEQLIYYFSNEQIQEEKLAMQKRAVFPPISTHFAVFWLVCYSVTVTF